MDFILKNKTILAEILSAATSFILQHVQQKKLISDHDYYELKGLSENPNKMTAELLDKLRARGQDTREKFTDLLKEEFIWEQYPRLRELFPPEPTDSVPAQEDQTDSDCLLPEKKRKTSGTNSDLTLSEKKRKTSGTNNDLTLSGLTWAKLEQYISQPGNGEKLIENLEKKLLADTMSKLEADLKSKTPKGNLSLNFEAIYKLETNRELTSFLKPGNGRKFPKIVIGTFFNPHKDREVKTHIPKEASSTPLPARQQKRSLRPNEDSNLNGNAYVSSYQGGSATPNQQAGENRHISKSVKKQESLCSTDSIKEEFQTEQTVDAPKMSSPPLAEKGQRPEVDGAHPQANTNCETMTEKDCPESVQDSECSSYNDSVLNSSGYGSLSGSTTEASQSSAYNSVDAEEQSDQPSQDPKDVSEKAVSERERSDQGGKLQEACKQRIPINKCICDWARGESTRQGKSLREILNCILIFDRVENENHPCLIAENCYVFQDSQNDERCILVPMDQMLKSKKSKAMVQYQMGVCNTQKAIVLFPDNSEPLINNVINNDGSFLETVKFWEKFVHEVLAPTLAVYKKIQKEQLISEGGADVRDDSSP